MTTKLTDSDIRRIRARIAELTVQARDAAQDAYHHELVDGVKLAWQDEAAERAAQAAIGEACWDEINRLQDLLATNAKG